MKNPAVPFKLFHGTSTVKSWKIIRDLTNDGVCINIFEGWNTISKKFKVLDKLSIPIFVDNGSFERFTQAFPKKKKTKPKLSKEEYFDFKNNDEYFKKVTQDYRELIINSLQPSNLFLTIPEVIGSSELTIELQKKYIPYYLKSPTRIIIAMQFNTKQKNWIEQLQKSAQFIKENAPKNWIVGIPFGNDFRLLWQKNNRFEEIEKIFDTILAGYKAHLFGCMSITKIKRFAFKEFIYSIDGSSVMNWAKSGHYVSTIEEKVLDIREIRGKRKMRNKTKEESGKFHQKTMELEGINWEMFVDEISYPQRYSINLIHLWELIEKWNIDFWKLKYLGVNKNDRYNY